MQSAQIRPAHPILPLYMFCRTHLLHASE